VRYSQPFGTPTPPLGSYPRYINGNPVTGTEGSIPPATAFDEDQVEIVTVIQNAGLTPDHNDLTQLWQAISALIAQKYITTPIIKKVHGSGADFVDLVAAFNWLAQYIITPTGSVTFMIPAGKWVYTQSVELLHPNLVRVTIQGAALLGATPQPGNLSVTGYFNSSDGTNQIIYLRSVHATELSFTGGVNGFTVFRPGCTLRYLLLTGSQTVATGGPTNIYGTQFNGNGICALSSIILDGISIWGFGSCGINIEGGGSIDMASTLSLVCAYNGWQGISAVGYIASAGANSWTILCSNAVSGISLFGSIAWLGKVSIKGHGPPNGNAAVHCEQGGLLVWQNGSEVIINQNGVIVAGCATLLAEGTNYSNNAQYGLWAHGQCMCWVDDSTFTGNGTLSILASEGAFVEALRSAVSSTPSPPPNALDTQGSYIAL
jgi:hypothetical protein